jgi:hypothetical protein
MCRAVKGMYKQFHDQYACLYADAVATFFLHLHVTRLGANT